MICPDCRSAGTILQNSKVYNGVTEAEICALHEQCRGGTWCDCAHQLSGVNWEAINREAANADS